MSTTTELIPDQYRSLVDDAAIFPPGNASLAEAARAHRAHTNASYATLVGPFVVSDARLPELIRVLESEEGDHPLDVSVVVTGGAGAIDPAVRWAVGSDVLHLRSVEIALRDETDLAHNARRVTTMFDQLAADGHLDDETNLFVEPPRLYDAAPSQSWLGALDELAAADLHLKLRTGGVETEAFPSATELATCLESAIDRELRFKCTAGLHNALRHRDPETGFEHHGFLNVLLATRATLDGSTAGDLAALLDETDRATLLSRLEEAGNDGLVSARRWFTSFGSCSVLEPLEDLVGLGLLPRPPSETA